MTDASSFDAVAFFGRMHPVLVHMPIGVIIALVVAEVAERFHYFRGSTNARGVLLILAVLSAAASIACGWMLSTSGGYEDDLIFWHKWGAVTFGALCLFALIAQMAGKVGLYRLLLVVALLVLIPAAHFGASMTHGRDYLVENAPAWVQHLAGYKSTESKPVPEKVAEKKDPQLANVYADVVEPIISKDCMSCHSADKMKGELRLDTLDAMKKGGERGPAVVPGDLDKSLLVQRVTMPPDQKGHMPPSGKPQLTDDQISLLSWWIESGAPTDKAVAQLNPPAKEMDLIDALFGVEPPKPVEAAPLTQITAKIEELSGSLHVVILPVAAGQPQLEVNAAVGRSFGDVELAKLTAVGPNIVDLDLAGTKVTDSGLAALAKMPNLQRLRLDRTAVGDTGIAQLSKLRNLQYLNLAETSVTDDSLKILRGVATLKQLYVWRTKIDAAAANAFADSMVDHAKVRKIRQQIEALQRQLDETPTAVYTGVATSKPSTMATTKPATTPAK